MNKKLINEIIKNLPKVIFDKSVDHQFVIEEIIGFTKMVEVIPLFTKSPDPKDNFLFDLAIQTESEVIVTKEKALLEFVESPVPIHNIKWFKENFPVPL